MIGEQLTRRMAGLLANVRRANRPPLHSMPVAQARLAYEASAEILDLPRAPLARVEAMVIEADDGTALPARLYAPRHGPLPTLLYLHGGGFTVGSLETHDSLCRQLALRSGAAVVALGYRLAPEHRFPTAILDAWAALRRLSRSADSLCLDGSRLAVGGDSAGATLAAVCAILARDADLPLALQVLVTPGTAAMPQARSRQLFAEGYLLEAPTIDWFFDQYIDPGERHDWRFAPLEAESLDGVAPACVVLAEFDPLVDEGLAYADRLRAAGVEVGLELYRGVTHDFIKMGRLLPEAIEAHVAIGLGLQAAFGAA